MLPFLQSEFRGIGLQLRSYRGTLGQGGRRKKKAQPTQMKKQKMGGSLENSNGQDAEPTDNKENLQSFSQKRQAVIKEKLDKWCEELGYKDTTVKMMLDYPDYSNDIISAECGFSSRSYLYRIFKEKEGCSPTVWRAKIHHKQPDKGHIIIW